MGRGRRAGGASDGDSQERAWAGASRHSEQHDQPCLDILESRTVERSEELDVQVMDIRKRVLGEEHPDTLTSMANLASIYWNQGRWKEAEELNVQVMEIRRRVLGEGQSHTLTSVDNLTLMLR